jgi:hypothetical protein
MAGPIGFGYFAFRQVPVKRMHFQPFVGSPLPGPPLLFAP